MKNNCQITIAICTYNRAKYLHKCLDSILKQVQCYSDVEVLVVDNNSTDSTKEVCEGFKKNNWMFRYVFAESQGLSFARNKAIDSAKGEWIAYLDDDAIAHKDYLERIKFIISNYNFDCFGGMYYAYYEAEKPKWISEAFGTKLKLSETVSEITEGYLSGGNLVVKKNVFNSVEKFETNLGMKGDKIGYGEEDKLQKDLRSYGYSIGFDPFLGIDHLVAPYKLKPSWHIARMYQIHKDSQHVDYKKYTLTHLVKRIILITYKDVPRLLKIFLKRKDYYVQNLFINIFSKYAICFGYYNNINKKK